MTTPQEPPTPDSAPDSDSDSALSPNPVAPPDPPADVEEEAEALLPDEVRQHAIDVRFSIPLFGRHYYLVILGGTELRNPERRARDRQRYPLLTLGNVLFLGWFVAAVYAFSVLVFLFMEGIWGA
jgi:hypothetical protein